MSEDPAGGAGGPAGQPVGRNGPLPPAMMVGSTAKPRGAALSPLRLPVPFWASATAAPIFSVHTH